MKFKIFVLAVIIVYAASCGNDGKKVDITAQPKDTIKVEIEELAPMQDLGIGPVKSLILGELDEEMVKKGEELFKAKCSACHKVDNRFIGPALAGVTERRSPEWIMNMILNPEIMVAENPAAKQLYAEYLSPMVNQGLTENEARLLLEYFRTLKVK